MKEEENIKPEFRSPRIIGDRLDVSERTIIRLILDGKLKAHRVGKLWRISEENYQTYLREIAYQASQN